MSVDDRVRRGLNEIAPADPSGAYERIVEKRVRRRIVRRAEAVALAVAVIIGSVAGFLALRRVFGGATTPAARETSPLIGFQVFDGKQTEIDVVDETTGETRTVARINGIVSGWDWSPDGRRIVYAQRGAGLFVLNADWTGLRHLDAPASAWAPRWAPNGVIAYTVDWETPRDDAIYVMDLGSQTTAMLYRASDLGTVDWSQDGTKLAFVGPGPEGDPQGWDIYTMNADGSDVANVTRHPAVDLDPVWSPNGSTILFRSRRAMPEGPISEDRLNERLYTIHPDGSNVVELTRDTTITQSPTWSPDGTQIAFDDGKGIVVANADGSNVRRVIGHGFGPVWRPVAANDALPSETPQGETLRPTETPESGKDIGLASNLCDVRTLKQIDFLGDGRTGTAWTGAPLTETGRCPTGRPNTYVVAVDVNGDGGADDAWRAIENCFECRPYAAADLDADGDDELVVLTSGGTTPRYDLLDVRATDAGDRLEPIRVAPPGDAEAGFPAGAIAGVSAGGDEGFSGYVSCEGFPEHPVIVAAWADGPVDGPGSEWRDTHVARLVIEHGTASVVDSSNGRAASDADLAYPFGTDNTACGVDWFPLS